MYDASVKEVAVCLRYAYRRALEKAEGKHRGREHSDFVSLASEFFRRYGFRVDQEFCTEISGIMLCGRPDLINPHERSIIEIKLLSGENLPIKPHEAYLRQLAGYMLLVEWAEYGELLFVSSMSGEIKVFRYRRKELKKYIQDFIKRIAKLRNALAMRREPEPESSPFCTKCPYRKECYTDIHIAFGAP